LAAQPLEGVNRQVVEIDTDLPRGDALVLQQRDQGVDRLVDEFGVDPDVLDPAFDLHLLVLDAAHQRSGLALRRQHGERLPWPDIAHGHDVGASRVGEVFGAHRNDGI
jgi:hypothetical protein